MTTIIKMFSSKQRNKKKKRKTNKLQLKLDLIGLALVLESSKRTHLVHNNTKRYIALLETILRYTYIIHSSDI